MLQETLPLGLSVTSDSNGGDIYLGYILPSLSDLDNDGDLDLLAIDRYYGDFYYYENTDITEDDNHIDGANFSSPQKNALNLSNLDLSYNSNTGFSLVDFDGDGDTDLLVTAGSQNKEFKYYENKDIDESDTTIEGASFEAVGGTPFNLPTTGYIYTYISMSFADLDGDGDQDMLMTEYDGGLYYLENVDIDTGETFGGVSKDEVDGAYFLAPIQNSFGLTRLENYFSELELADLDGDGDFDILSCGLHGAFYYLENLDVATTAPFGGVADAIDAPLFKGPLVFGLSLIKKNSKPILGDLDDDGDLDLLSGKRDGSFSYFQNSGTANSPNFQSPTTNSYGLDDIGNDSAPALGDLDGDGDLDLLSGKRDGSFSYFQNSGTANSPNFQSPTTNSYGLDDIGNDSAPALGDLDGDGDLDLLSGHSSGHFYYFENSGTSSAPNFQTSAKDPYGLGDTTFQSTPALGDLDGDGDLDLLSGVGHGHFYYFQNSGTSSVPDFQTSVTNSYGLSYDIAPALGDLDGDGDLDLLLGNFRGRFVYFENVDQDLDNDGILDTQEVTFWENDESVTYDIWGDEDGDGIPNYRDVVDDGDNGDGSTTNYTNTNGDTIPDIFDTDLDGKPNYVDLDSDNDGIPDVIEAQSTSGFITPDLVYGTDDGVDTAYTNGLAPVDTDADQIPDFLDTDSDNDGQSDVNETGFGLNGTIADNGLDTALGYTDYADPRAGKSFEDYSNDGNEYNFRIENVTVSVNIKVYLEGAFDEQANLMRDDLRGVIPSTSPYTDAIIADASVFNTTGPTAIVDWISIELRNKNDISQVVAASSAFVLRNGNVVAIDGVSELQIGAPEDAYYVAISHRNHIGIVTNQTIELTADTTTSINLTNDTSTLRGAANAVKEVVTGVFALLAGDSDANEQIQNSDIPTLRSALGTSGYLWFDIDLNTQVQNTDINNYIIPNTGKGKQF